VTSRFWPPTARGLLLATLAVGALAVAAERLIQTDREALEALLQRAADAASLGDVRALARTLDEDYAAEGRNREQAVAYARTLWDRYRPTGLRITQEIRDLGEDEAHAEALVSARVMGIPVRVPVALVYRRTGDGWRIHAAVQTGPPE
jgi:hypothetical protein